MSSPFFVTRRDPVTGRKVEVALCDIPRPGAPGGNTKEQALSRFQAVLPELLAKTEERIRTMEQKAAAGQVRSMEQTGWEKELTRFRRRLLILREGRFPCGISDGLDPVWGQYSDKFMNDALVAGLAVDDSFQPSGTVTAPSGPTPGLAAKLAQAAVEVRRLEQAARAQAEMSDRNRAADLAEKADICYYVAGHLDQGDLPTNKHIDRIIDLFAILLPAWSAAQAEGRLSTVDHDANMKWVQEYRAWEKQNRRWK
jgi:hypothetical protein